MEGKTCERSRGRDSDARSAAVRLCGCARAAQSVASRSRDPCEAEEARTSARGGTPEPLGFARGQGGGRGWRTTRGSGRLTARGASSPAKPALHMPEPFCVRRTRPSSQWICRAAEGWERAGGGERVTRRPCGARERRTSITRAATSSARRWARVWVSPGCPHAGGEPTERGEGGGRGSSDGGDEGGRSRRGWGGGRVEREEGRAHLPL